MRDEDLRAFERALETGDLEELRRVGPLVARHARGLALPPSEEREKIAARLAGWAAFWRARSADDPAHGAAFDNLWLGRIEDFAREIRQDGGIRPPPDVQGPGIDLPRAPRDPLGILSPNFVRDLAIMAGAAVVAGQAQRAMLNGFKLDRPAEPARRKHKAGKRKRQA